MAEQEGPLITYRCTRVRACSNAAAVPQRPSSHLAAKAPANFVDMTTQAVQCKALLNSLSRCSAKLKKHVTKRNILSHNNLPFEVGDLRKLVSAARFGCQDVDVIDTVSTMVK